MPWSGTAPAFGFSDNPDTWLPMPPDWAQLTVDKQLADDDSTLHLYRRASELRRSRTEFTGKQVVWLDSPAETLVFRRGGLVCVLNAGERPVVLPEGQLILSSAPAVDDALPPNAAAWLV
jgi:alpha-glucosidase